MQLDQIKCPQCNNVTRDLSAEIHKVEGKHYLQYCCPKCGFVFKQKKSWSQGMRILAIVIFIPASMFAALFFAILIGGSVFASYLSFIIFPIIIVFFIFLIYACLIITRKIKLRNVSGDDFKKYRYRKEAVNAGDQEKNMYQPSNDPLMDKIRLDAFKEFKKGQPKEKKRKNLILYISKYFFVAVILASTIFFAWPDIMKITGNYKKSTNELRNKLIEYQAQRIISLLHLKYGTNYPRELTPDFYDLYNIPEPYDNNESEKYLGETIGLEDFIYTGYGNSFRLCIKASLGGKCWGP